jgi:hypothetical protein
MRKPVIEINGKKYTIAFNYGSHRTLSKIWNIKTFGELIKRLSKFSDMGEDPTFEQIDDLRDVIFSGIQGDFDEDQDLIIGEVIYDSTKMAEIMEVFAASFPQEKKSNPAKPASPKKRKK